MRATQPAILVPFTFTRTRIRHGPQSTIHKGRLLDLGLSAESLPTTALTIAGIIPETGTDDGPPAGVRAACGRGTSIRQRDCRPKTEPDLWHQDRQDASRRESDVGLPDPRRLQTAATPIRWSCCSYGGRADLWVAANRHDLAKLGSLTVIARAVARRRSFLALARRTMRLTTTSGRPIVAHRRDGAAPPWSSGSSTPACARRPFRRRHRRRQDCSGAMPDTIAYARTTSGQSMVSARTTDSRPLLPASLHFRSLSAFSYLPCRP